MECIFCEIIAKKEKSYTIYENNYVIAILDIDPINNGHVLVIPKKHYEEFTEVDQDTLSNVIFVAQKIARVIEEILQPDGITVMQNNGVFKDVNHYHMHVFPRFENDGFGWVEPDFEVNEEDLIAIFERLKKAM
ncbi:Diadenosine tetraphosphate (Ap4A) HIT family hydrolase OS=Ureibacillus acetophenoni OX=614649 GN=SAMN05877842_11796 PE=4 SV=1 [Ureibacillus acetophenoni]